MNFNLDVGSEWLARRRENVAQASRKIRAKKKQEREVLSQENLVLKEERNRLLQHIVSLEAEIAVAPEEAKLDLENKLLREQLEQHKGFLRGLFQQLGALEPDETSSRSELSKQNKEFAMMHFVRLISESQRPSAKWTRGVLPPVISLSKPLNGSVYYSRCDSALHFRIDLIVPRIFNPQLCRDLLSSAWGDLTSFENIFGPGSIALSQELMEFRCDTEEETMKAFHQREAPKPGQAEFRDTVYLTAKGRKEMIKSTLDIGPDRVLTSISSMVEISNWKRRTGNEDVGVAMVHYGLRTISEHGQIPVEECSPTTRIMSTALEGIFCWVDSEQETSHVLWMFTFPPGFDSHIGKPEAYLDQDGNLTQCAGLYFQRLVELACCSS